MNETLPCLPGMRPADPAVVVCRCEEVTVAGPRAPVTPGELAALGDARLGKEAPAVETGPQDNAPAEANR